MNLNFLPKNGKSGGKYILVSLISLAGLYFTVLAGSLTPSLSPASTFHTLTDIWDSIASGSYDSSGIAADANGSLIAGIKYLNNNLAWASGSNNIWNLNSGNVGVGTTSPSGKFNIYSVGENIIPLKIQTNASVVNSYTATNSAVFIYDAAGQEMVRIWATDPDPTFSNYNAWNLYIGRNAGAEQYTNSSGDGAHYRNTGVGYDALASNSYGWDNAAFGTQALRALTTGYENTAVGNQPLLANTTGYQNIAIGAAALYSNTTGGRNSAAGSYSGFFNITGGNNTAYGFSSLYLNTTGSFNSAFGVSALSSNKNGNYNVAVGYSAGTSASSSNNIFIGSMAGDNLTTGNNNLIIGYDVDAPTALGSNQLNIGNIIFGNTINGTGTTVSAGGISIGASNSRGSRLRVTATAAGGTASASFSLVANSWASGSIASISATALTSGGSVMRFTVGASTSKSTNYLLVKDTNNVTYASLGYGGRLSLRRDILAHGSTTNCTGAGAPSAGCIDYAENFPSQDESLEAADVVAVSTTTGSYVVKALSSDVVLGIVSTNPAALITGETFETGTNTSKKFEGQVPVALAGRVPVKFSNENGEVVPGDRLTVSNTKPGYAMKATISGMTLGIALEPSLNQDKVLTFINLTYWATTIPQSNNQSDSQGLFASILEYLREAVVEIKKLVVKDEICIGQTCVNESQLKEILDKNVSSTPNPTPETILESSGGNSDGGLVDEQQTTTDPVLETEEISSETPVQTVEEPVSEPISETPVTPNE